MYDQTDLWVKVNSAAAYMYVWVHTVPHHWVAGMECAYKYPSTPNKYITHPSIDKLTHLVIHCM